MSLNANEAVGRGSRQSSPGLAVPRLYAVVVALIGAAFLFGGAWLAALGGSFYYLLAGILLCASAGLLWKGRTDGMWLYLTFLGLTIIWSIWESGFYGWALIPRLAIFTVMALLMLVPAFRRNLRPSSRWATRFGSLSMLVVLSLGLVAAILVGAGLQQMRDIPVDPVHVVKASPPMTPSPVQLAAHEPAGDDWTSWGGDKGGMRYSTLTDITPENVSGLKVAWRYHTGPKPEQYKDKLTSFEATPLKVGDTLYFCTAFNEAIALDAETGEQRWRYNPHVDAKPVYISTCRGVAYYKAPMPLAECQERIIGNTIDARLYALDAKTGKPCKDFGQNGQVSLLTGMGDLKHNLLPGYYYITSAPTIARGKIIVGGSISDNQYVGEPSGVIRAFDAVTGKFAWAFDVGRLDYQGQPAEGETYTPGTPNSWAQMSVDEELGAVYAPTGNPSPDIYGGVRRPFDEKFGSSVVAIDAETGKLRWSFQTTHHDLWDYDVPAQPTLVDLPVPGGVAHALIQPTKRGETFVLDRVTGKPLTRVDEIPVPTDGAPGDHLSPTQPFSTGMPSLAGPVLTENMMWGISPFDQLYCRIQFKRSHYEGPLTPPSVQPYIESPGYLGGTNWGSASVDPEKQIMLINSSRIAVRNYLIPRKEADKMGLVPEGTSTDPNAPMRGSSDSGDAMTQAGTPYGVATPPFLSPLGAPCQQPPYGMLTAVDLKTKQAIWTRTLGTAADSGPLGIRSMLPLPLGTPNAGGSLITKSGLVFIGATQERVIRAIDEKTGDILWKSRLPAGGMATPMTYRSPGSGRQFVLISVGGNSLMQAGYSDEVIAYALPGAQ